MNTIPISKETATRRDFTAEVRKFVLKSFPRARAKEVKDSDTLLESGLIDSQGILEVVAFIEREFSTVVDEEELSPENFQSIDRVAAFIRSKIAGSGVA